MNRKFTMLKITKKGGPTLQMEFVISMVQGKRYANCRLGMKTSCLQFFFFFTYQCTLYCLFLLSFYSVKKKKNQSKRYSFNQPKINLFLTCISKFLL